MKKEVPKWKVKISKQDRLILLGLMHMASEHYKESSKCDVAMNKLIGVKEKWGSRLSDEWLEDKPNLDGVLKDMGIKVI